VLERHIIGRAMNEWDLGGFFRDLAAGALRHRIRLPADFTMMFKAMVTTEGLARQVARGINPVDAARPYVEALVRERYGFDRLRRLAFVEGIRLLDIARGLPGALERLLSRLEQGDIVVRLRHESLEPEVTRVVRALNRGAVSIVVAASSLTGALTLDHGRAVALGLPALSLLSFAVSTAGLVWLVAGVLRGR